MKKVKPILLKILFPPMGIIVSLVPVSAVMLIYSFAYENANPAVQYLSYFVSAYSLTIVCAKFPMVFRRVRNIKQQNKYLSHYFDNAALRVKISLHISFVINMAYVVIQLGLGLYNCSVWFYALAGYYLLLAVMRYFLLKEKRTDKAKTDLYSEYLSYRFCGIILLFMNIVLSVIVFYIVRQNKGFFYHYIMTIAMAAYTFFIFTVAVVNLVRYRKYNSPVMSASKAINLAAALVSMLSLETAMLNAFGDGDSVFRKTITGYTGTAVCTTILLMAIYMIVHSAVRLHQIKRKDAENG